jgi:hypothetical protein
MRRNVQTLIVAILGACAVNVAHADSCSSLVCMMGMVQGGNGGGCDGPIKDFMSIIETHHGHFDASATPDARREFLNQCPGSSQNTSQVDSIISQFGTTH